MPTVVLQGSLPDGTYLDPTASALIEEALQAGDAVIVPAQPVDVGGKERLAWWRVDPLTGTTSDMTDDGTGSETVEYTITLRAAFCSIALVAVGPLDHVGLGEEPDPEPHPGDRDRVDDRGLRSGQRDGRQTLPRVCDRAGTCALTMSPRVPLALGLAAALALGLGISVVTPALAQADCTPEVEPNDTESTASQLEGALCVEGVLLDGDQDLLIWDLPASQASTLWRVEVDGMPGVLTSLKVFGITSEPGVEPIVASGAPILDVGKDPAQEGAVTQDGVLLPVGRYLLGHLAERHPGRAT